MEVSRARFVGRAAELDSAGECLDAALNCNPRIVLCHGEAGIGKTRLTEEVFARAADRGFVPVWGVAEQMAGAPPFWPWNRILRALSRRLDLVGTANADGTAAELSGVAPGLFMPSESAHAAAESADDRFRQFDALARLLHDLSDAAPLAIALDDAHWADEASLRALIHVATGLTTERLLVWVNAREESGTHQAELLSRITRVVQARALPLRGLTDDAIREQLRQLTGRAVSDVDVQHTRVATAGNPFFVGEMARMLTNQTKRGPRAVPTRGAVDAVSARLVELAPMTASALRAASVLGQEFDTTLLASVLGVAPLDAAALLDDARGAGLVESAAAPGRQRFVHALVRDAVAAGMQTSERVVLHRRAAVAIEGRFGGMTDDQVFAIAEHWAHAAEGGDVADAAVWLERAGDVAMRQLAYEEAERLYAEAVRVGGGALGDDVICRLHLSRARAASRCGALSTGFQAVMAAAEHARRTGRVDLLAATALAMEPVGVAGFDLLIRRLCQEVLSLIDPDMRPLRARLLSRFAETYIYLPDPEPAKVASVEALAVADASGDVTAIAAALRARQVVIADPEGLEERELLMTRAVELGRAEGDAALELQGRLGVVDAAFERGDLGRVAFEAEAAARCARAIGGVFARFKVLQLEAVLAQAQGRFEDCRAKLDEAVGLMRAMDHHEPILMRAAVLSAVARHIGPDDAVLAASGIADGADAADRQLITAPGLIAAISMANVQVHAGRIDEAAAVLTAQGPPATWRPPPHVVLLVYALGLEVAITLGQRHDVAALHQRLRHHRGHHVACGLVAASYQGPVELWLGKASRHLGHIDVAIGELEDAVARSTESGAQGFAVESQVELAAALIARGTAQDVTRARETLGEATTNAERLGMPPWRRRIRELSHVLESSDKSPLTHREREIADLVAGGLTNRQIAARLFLSERTAQNHVQHILDKLGLDNRSQIAVWVERIRAGAAAN